MPNCEATIDTKITQFEHLLTEANANLPTRHNKPAELEVPIVSPNARLFLELIQRADYYLLLNAQLWLEGEIDDRNKANSPREIRKIILNIINGVRSQFNFVRKQVTKRRTASEQSGVPQKEIAEAA